MTRPTLTGTPDAVPTVELDELLEGGDLELIDRWLGQADVVEIADELSRLPREQRAVPFRLLAADRALEVFELLDPSLQQELLEGLRDDERARSCSRISIPTTGRASPRRCRPRSRAACWPASRRTSGA